MQDNRPIGIANLIFLGFILYIGMSVWNTGLFQALTISFIEHVDHTQNRFKLDPILKQQIADKFEEEEFPTMCTEYFDAGTWERFWRLENKKWCEKFSHRQGELLRTYEDRMAHREKVYRMNSNL